MNVDENSKDIKSQNDQETDDQDKGNDGTRIHLSPCTHFTIFTCVVTLTLSQSFVWRLELYFLIQ